MNRAREIAANVRAATDKRELRPRVREAVEAYLRGVQSGPGEPNPYQGDFAQDRMWRLRNPGRAESENPHGADLVLSRMWRLGWHVAVDERRKASRSWQAFLAAGGDPATFVPWSELYESDEAYLTAVEPDPDSLVD